MLKQYQFKTVHAHKNEYSQFFFEWDLELFSINTSGPLLNWVSFVFLALGGKKAMLFHVCNLSRLKGAGLKPGSTRS